MSDLDLTADGEQPRYGRHNTHPRPVCSAHIGGPAGHLRPDRHDGRIISVAPYLLSGDDWREEGRDYPFDHIGIKPEGER